VSESHNPKTFFLILVLTVLVAFPPVLRGQDKTSFSADFTAAIEADWDAQEKRLGRDVSSLKAIGAILFAAGRLLTDLSRGSDILDLGAERAALAELKTRATDVDALTVSERTKLYHDIRWVARSIALKNPLIAGKRIIFMKRRRFICQMLHEYLGYYYDYEDIAGGGIYLLGRPGYSFESQHLTKDITAKGNYTTLALSYDAETIYFAFAERASTGHLTVEQKPDYYSDQRK
jgi:hypothetical protein